MAQRQKTPKKVESGTGRGGRGGRGGGKKPKVVEKKSTSGQGSPYRNG